MLRGKRAEVNSLGKALPAEASVLHRHSDMDRRTAHLRFDLGHIVGTSLDRSEHGGNESRKVHIGEHGQSVGIGVMSKSLHEFSASLSRE